MDVFETLGKEIDARWRRAHRAIDALPTIATELLGGPNAPHRRVDPNDVIRWATSSATVLPPQRDLEATFGNPPITIYRSDEFSIDLLYWLDGSTAIHDHGFCGVWQVFAGSSLHCVHDFHAERRYGERCATGSLKLRETELLRVGDVRPIVPGAGFIHALYHLERPTVSLLVRTDASRTAVQLTYHRPGVAQANRGKTPHLVRTLQCLTYLKAAAPGEFVQRVMEACEDVDAHSLYWILKTATNLLEGDEEAAAALRAHALSSHGPLADILFRAFTRARMDLSVLMQRRPLANADHRFLLALLVNVEGVAACRKVLQQRHPKEDPWDLVIRWTRELWGNDQASAARDKLRIPAIDDTTLAVLRGLLDGLDTEKIGRQVASTASTLSLDVDARVTQLRESALGPLVSAG
jgi:hypothetical protein